MHDGKQRNAFRSITYLFYGLRCRPPFGLPINHINQPGTYCTMPPDIPGNTDRREYMLEESHDGYAVVLFCAPPPPPPPAATAQEKHIKHDD
jgi:hypothetical protein